MKGGDEGNTATASEISAPGSSPGPISATYSESPVVTAKGGALTVRMSATSVRSLKMSRVLLPSPRLGRRPCRRTLRERSRRVRRASLSRASTVRTGSGSHAADSVASSSPLEAAESLACRSNSICASRQKFFHMSFPLTGTCAGCSASTSDRLAPWDIIRLRPLITLTSCSARRAARFSRARSPRATRLSIAVSVYIWKKSSTS